jgi:hypothetical protein
MAGAVTFLQTNGDSRAATLEQAKADFQAAWVAFKTANMGVR